MSEIKTYKTTCFRNRGGKLVQINVNRKYTVKNPSRRVFDEAFRDEIKQKIAIGITKNRLMTEYNISLYMLNKLLAE